MGDAESTPAMADERRSGPWSKVLLGCAAALLAAAVLVLALLGTGFRSAMRFGIASDLSEYYAKVSSCDLPPEVKRPVLDKIDAVRQKARRSPMGFWKWLDYDESISRLLDEAPITAEDLEAVVRELDRAQKEMGGK
ncbi:MAG: hypothetical protein U0166_14710 [Acidobacteriota bacterium]